jgi:O-antigen/teichoic acid export membrane protein
MIRKIFHKYQNSLRFRQVISLLTVNVVGIPITIVSSIIITRFLGPSVYGDFKFLSNLFILAVTVFTFGFFQAGNRALVLNSDPQKAKEYYGSELVILGVLFLIMTFFFLGYAFFDKNINEKGLRNILIILIPFSWVFLLGNYFEVMFQADNKIKLLANSRLYPKLWLLISVVIIYFGFTNYTGNRLIIILLFFIATQIIVYINIIHKIKLSFNNIRMRIREILFFNRTYGFNVYIGSVCAVGFSQLTGVLISYFGIDNTGVGYYSLATTIAAPLSFIPNVIATTHYKDFSTKTSISVKLLMLTIAISISALVLIILLVSPFIKYFYGPEFYPVIHMTVIVSFGVILSGFADFLNRFLGSHGKGKSLRNSAILVGLGTMVFNLTLIPRFGETGAIYTQLFSGLIYILCMVWFYWKLVQNLKKN